MNKIYKAPTLEVLAFYSDSPISNAWSGEEPLPEADVSSFPWNNGELGWT